MYIIPIIAGSTATGKTQTAIELAKEINGEIISADSMQIYKFMNIGTAKPDTEEMQGIRHYLIDEIYPDEEFSVAKYKEKALYYIDKILSNGKIPIIVGGTGLYINSLIYNIDFAETICDWELREALKKEALEKGNEYIYKKLEKIDPKTAKKLHINDTKRIIRAIEVFTYTKKPMSYFNEESIKNPPKHNFVLFGLTMDREKLYERINLRVDKMIEKGLVEEVKGIINMGYDKNLNSLQGIGYKEIILYIEGNISLEEAVFIIKRNSRRYAKRQVTWFKRLPDIKWIDVLELCDVKNRIKNMVDSIAISRTIR